MSRSCGYTKIFQETESGTPAYKRLPLPWNSVYKTSWQTFLYALEAQIGSEPSFVSIAVAGPTASSAEIILPNGKNQPATLSVGVDVFTAWNCLLGNNYGVSGSCLSGSGYGATSSYINSDRAFVEEWAAAIDMFGQIFSGVTLTVATGRGPNFRAPLRLSWFRRRHSPRLPDEPHHGLFGIGGLLISPHRPSRPQRQDDGRMG